MLGSPQQSRLAARGPAKARASGLYANTAYGNRIVEAWTSALAGPGYQARSQHRDPATRRRLNDAFEALINPLLVPAVRGLVRDGEAFIQILTGNTGDLRLKLIPADQIDPALSRDLEGGARIIAGIEFDTFDNVTAYHVLRDAPGAPFANAHHPRRHHGRPPPRR